MVGRTVGSAPELIALVQIPGRNDKVDQGEQMIYTPTSTFDLNITNNTSGSSGAILGVGLQYAAFMQRYYLINDWPVYDTDVVLYGYNSEEEHINIQLIFEEVKLSKVGKLQSLARIATLTREKGGTEGFTAGIWTYLGRNF